MNSHVRAQVAIQRSRILGRSRFRVSTKGDCRRTFCNQILQIIKDEGGFSNYCIAQWSNDLPLPVLSCINMIFRKDFPIALDEFASLSGRLTASGNSLFEARLLQTAGLDQLYEALMKAERLTWVYLILEFAI
ncbi:hypothetical protein FRX31_010836 [Thalictrum thalictroides]|uniref:Uncharacterized protein n=1 Tax=Thalictrum thalictroides TaxID=46969 RepID=A0A7J6WRK5_THATH|nr:hypothetical protein FRX31_010836 [Thalictrum thalictroides]